MKKLLAFKLLLLSCTTILSQEKKPINLDAILEWNRISKTQISNYGNLFSYEIKASEGQQTLVFGNIAEPKLDSVFRGSKAKIAPSEEYVIFTINPPKTLVDSVALAKQNKEKGASKAKVPKDSLGIYNYSLDTIIKLPKVKSYQVPKDSGIAYGVLLKSDFEKKDKKEKEEPKKESWLSKLFTKEIEPVKEPRKNKPSAQVLLIGNCYEPDFDKVENVKSFSISDAGNRIAYLKSNTDTLDSLEVWVYDPENSTHTQLFQATGEAKGFTFNPTGDQMAFYYSADTNQNKQFNLMYWKMGDDSVVELVSEPRTMFPASYSLSGHAPVFFSENGKKLFFGYGKTPKADQKDTVLTNNLPKVDVWSWHDTYLQPHQKKKLERQKNKFYQAVLYIDSRKIILLEDSLTSSTLVKKGDSDFGFLVDGESKANSMSWDISYPRDIYRINHQNGQRDLLLENIKYGHRISPEGKFICYYNELEKHWYLVDALTKNKVNITKQISSQFDRREHDTPAPAYPYGLAGWSENDKEVLLYDEFDIWIINTSNPSEFKCLTKEQGKATETKFRIFKAIPDQKYIDLKNKVFLTGFNDIAKENGIYNVLLGSNPTPLLREDGYNIYPGPQARFANKMMLTKMSFYEYGDRYITNTTFNEIHRISNANPQQKEYLWAQNELVSWKNTKGEELEGILIKPENFDKTKKYPMLVYFYERRSSTLNMYNMPRPSASIISPVHYASNGYVVFIPDITYNDGHPGESAFEDIVSGTDYVTSLGFVNDKKIGIQGQSWGGYQVAYLVTKTNKYAAAMAGAPVSNMTSAYGGIRWGSGLSRMFQYEKTQSRIGKTLWDGLDLYIENSPLFFADKVETPLLMMHNDNDGAVPWYQGIEYFVALRRLNKPVWMLTYNKEEHNLRKLPNKKDLTIRMKQFFDHYLMDAPAPVWMVKGIPAEKKGVEYRYELMEK